MALDATRTLCARMDTAMRRHHSSGAPTTHHSKESLGVNAPTYARWW